VFVSFVMVERKEPWVMVDGVWAWTAVNLMINMIWQLSGIIETSHRESLSADTLLFETDTIQ